MFHEKVCCPCCKITCSHIVCQLFEGCKLLVSEVIAIGNETGRLTYNQAQGGKFDIHSVY